MSFQARVPQHIKEEILDTAVNYGAKAVKQAKRQIRDIESWGTRDSFINLAHYDKATNSINFVNPEGFVLTNENARLLDEVDLPKRKTMFQSFMALREKDIVSAEKELNANIAAGRPAETTGLDIFA